jgi:hypothetical protein
MPELEFLEEYGGQSLDELIAMLNQLDNEYYDCDEPIADRLFAFVKQNRSRIRIP